MISLMKVHCRHSITLFIFSLFYFVTLTGCPGIGDRLAPDEEGHIIVYEEGVCFSFNNGDNYILKYISINPRGTRLRDEKIILNPPLHIVNAFICIPSSLYKFNKDGQCFIRANFTFLKNSTYSRRIFSALEVSNGVVHNIRSDDMEILRPYDEMIQK